MTVMIGLSLFGNVIGQTAGTLTFSVKTYAPYSSKRQNQHVLAIWIESASGEFVKTKSHFGPVADDDHLYQWTAKSGSSLVDATTGATVMNYDKPVTFTWNGTNVDGAVVADGVYKIFVEMGWGSSVSNEHSYSSFTFTKGTSSSYTTPAATANYSNVQITWTPTSTVSTPSVFEENLCTYPNPTDGIIILDFLSSVSNSELIVQDLTGKILFTEAVNIGFSGKRSIDLSSFSNGIYFLTVITGNKSYSYKVILNRN
jgi:hypothetical protein